MRGEPRRLRYCRDCSSLPGLNRTALPGGMATSAPVRGLRPMPVLRGRTLKMPKPRSSMRSPWDRARFMLSKTVSTAISALVLVMPVLFTTSLIMSSLITVSPLGSPQGGSKPHDRIGVRDLSSERASWRVGGLQVSLRLYEWVLTMSYIPPDARWYLADIVEEFRIESEPENIVHTNTILVRADSPEEAYQSALALGKKARSLIQTQKEKPFRFTFEA